MLNWIPEWYLDLMYQCCSDDFSERPTAAKIFDKIYDNTVNNNVMRQLEIADDNQKNISKSQKQELFELFSSKLHPQSCYISQYIHTLHELQDLLEEMKSGKSSAIPSANIHNIDRETEIQSRQKNGSNESNTSSVKSHSIDRETEAQNMQGNVIQPCIVL
ncbi:10564_t:CDS:2 [Diversispora eburnea]|uniref:10564_t:CDS:1 n=1 Tax=Diversispora eburnea TaxID=1213867 RepID=A0A9N9B524_9GLOM|nr:10564_t:CDS:2 [Diversispora eburnea]